MVADPFPRLLIENLTSIAKNWANQYADVAIRQIGLHNYRPTYLVELEQAAGGRLRIKYAIVFHTDEEPSSLSLKRLRFDAGNFSTIFNDQTYRRVFGNGFDRVYRDTPDENFWREWKIIALAQHEPLPPGVERDICVCLFPVESPRPVLTLPSLTDFTPLPGEIKNINWDVCNGLDKFSILEAACYWSGITPVADVRTLPPDARTMALDLMHAVLDNGIPFYHITNLRQPLRFVLHENRNGEESRFLIRDDFGRNGRHAPPLWPGDLSQFAGIEWFDEYYDKTSDSTDPDQVALWPSGLLESIPANFPMIYLTRERLKTYATARGVRPVFLFPKSGPTESESRPESTPDAGKVPQLKRDAAFPCPPGTEWEQIYMRLLDEQTIHIRTPIGDGRFSYHDLGLVDGRKGSAPSLQWKLLQQLPLGNGFLHISDEGYIDNLKTKASDLNKRLKAVFGIEESIFTDTYNKNKLNPVTGDYGKGYQTRFRISSMVVLD